MNCKYLFKDIPPAKLHAIVADPKIKAQWVEAPIFKVISEDPNEKSFILHQVGKKPSVPMISAREFVSKMYKFDGYLLKEDSGDEAHLSVRVHVENDIPKNDNNNVRGKTICMGELILPNKDINGCELHTIGYQEFSGNLPKMLITQISNKKAAGFPAVVYKFAETFDI